MQLQQRREQQPLPNVETRRRGEAETLRKGKKSILEDLGLR